VGLVVITGCDLVIELMTGGAGTNYIFEEVKTGVELSFRGPQGGFTLPDALEEDHYLICTGTGIAPFRSMLHEIATKNIPHKDVYLIFGTRTKESLLYYEELTALAKNHQGIHYVPVLSREKWEGAHGYVHKAYMDIINGKRADGALPPSHFYLCGWRHMIDEAKKHILEMGFDKTAVHQELYG